MKQRAKFLQTIIRLTVLLACSLAAFLLISVGPTFLTGRGAQAQSEVGREAATSAKEATLPATGTPPKGESNPPANKRVLMFVAYNDVWWAEYKVVYEALLAQGYEVEVRSSADGEAFSYGSSVDNTPSGAGLDPAYPNPASYAEFQALFQANFGLAWNGAWNAPQSIPLDGRIQDVVTMDQYDALVLPGGRGAVAYRYDGAYADLSPRTRRAAMSPRRLRCRPQPNNSIYSLAWP